MTTKPTIVRDMPASILSNVFGLTKGQAPAVESYDVNLASGALKISHTMIYEPEMSDEYKAEVRYDGTVNFVTANDKRIIEDLPNTGDIVTLMETADGDYAGILKKVYGVTDADADAFGTDGTYSINSDGSITLTTGEQTIQLKFDPANGSLTTANGRSDGMVNLVFN
jgi:flagellar hook protein FlgE